MTLSTIYTDADNTLWNTDAVFQAAQLALLEQMEGLVGQVSAASDRLAFVREYDQAIASFHHERLRYPPHLLAHALTLGLRGMSHAEAARRVIRGGVLPGTEAGVQRFLEMLKTLPPLLPGVTEGLRLAASHGLTIYVVTEGPREKVLTTLKEHGLLDQTMQVLSATKTVDLYRRLKTLGGVTSAAMIGDQLDRDVVLAREAGLVAIWIPSAFRPKWFDSSASSMASFVAWDFLIAINWLIATALQNDAVQVLPHSKAGP